MKLQSRFGRFGGGNVLALLETKPRYLGCSVPSAATKPTILSKHSLVISSTYAGFDQVILAEPALLWGSPFVRDAAQ